MVLDFDWQVLKLWKRRDDPIDAAGRTLRKATRQTVMLWRDDIWTRVEPIAPAQGAILRRLISGESLGTLFAASPGASEKETTSWFASWMGLGLIRRIQKI
jgi:hypothetical protein